MEIAIDRSLYYFQTVKLSLRKLCVLCLSAVIFPFTAEAQKSPIDFPDLSQLETDVRVQIQAQQDALVDVLKDPKSTNTQLSAVYGSLGEIYQAYSLNAPARECYLRAIKLAPKDFRWIYFLGKLDQIDGRVDDAIERYRTVVSLQPDFVAVLVNLGNIYLELDRLEEAKTSFASALQKQSMEPAAHYGLGQVALSKRNYAEAVEHFEKALALTPEANRIHYALAMAYRGLRNSEKTKFHLAQQGPVGVRVADPLMNQLHGLAVGVRVYLVRGKTALEAKRYEEAAAEFRKAIAVSPNSVPAHVNLGAALTQLGDQKGAAEEFEKALVIDSKNVTARFNLAVLLANDKQHEQAVVHLQKIALLYPNDYGARSFLVQQLLFANRPEQALKLAQSLYSTTGSLQHGLLVISSLAKLKRCDDVTQLQAKLLARAVEERNDELQVKLKAVSCQP